MSTILDALRKVEEEKRTQEADVRTRLLANSSRFDFRTRRRSHLPWIVGGGLVLVGTLIGAGMMVWRSSGPSSETEVAPSTTGAPQVASVPPPQGQITPNVAAVVPPKEPTAVVPAPAVPKPRVAPSVAPVIAEPTPQYNPWHGGNPSPAIGNGVGRSASTILSAPEVVQRSPFVNSSPYDRIVAPPPVPPPSAPRVVAVPKSPVRRSPAPEKSIQSPPAGVSRSDTAENEARPRSAASPASAREDTTSSPPNTSLTFLQWSADPEKRVASIKVGTGPATIAHEGDSVEGMTVVKIRPDAVELRSGESRYLLKAR